MELCAERDLTSYSRFTRGSVSEFMSLFCRTVAERTKPGQRQDVEEQSYTFHAYARTEGVAGIIISDHEYPALVAHQLLGKIVDEFLSKYPKSAYSGANASCPMPQLKEYIVKYQDPGQADSIMKVRSIQLHAMVVTRPYDVIWLTNGTDPKGARRDQDRTAQDHRVRARARRED